MDKDIVRKAHRIKNSVEIASKTYFHTNPIATARYEVILPKQNQKHSFELRYNIKEILSAAAFTNSPVLITGGTDTGKTTLAKLVMAGLFGNEDEEWHRIDMDTDFGKDAYTDMDFGVIVNGKKSSEGMYNINPWLALPGLIIDEMNRTHASLANKLIHFLDKDISLPNGERVRIGVEAGDKIYQFQIANINEGSEYGGTFQMDKALRRRTTIEIPIDSFPPTPSDKLEIQRSKGNTSKLEMEGHLEDILDIYMKVDQVPVHPIAEMFVSYLQSFDYCRRLRYGKGTIPKPEARRAICSGNPNSKNAMELHSKCDLLNLLDNTELCPNVRALSNGVAKNLVYFSKGMALIRATKFTEMVHGFLINNQFEGEGYTIFNPNKFAESLQKYTESNLEGRELAVAAVEKYVNNLEVELADIEASINLVAYSKIDLSQSYINKHFKGDRFAAIQHFVKVAENKFQEGLINIGPANLSAIENGDINAKERAIEYCVRENPWMGQVIEAISHKKPSKELDCVKLYD